MYMYIHIYIYYTHICSAEGYLQSWAHALPQPIAKPVPPGYTLSSCTPHCVARPPAAASALAEKRRNLVSKFHFQTLRSGQCYFPHYSVTIRRIMSSSPGSHWLWFPHDSGPPKASRCRRSGSNGRRAFRTFRGRALLGCWKCGWIGCWKRIINHEISRSWGDFYRMWMLPTPRMQEVVPHWFRRCQTRTAYVQIMLGCFQPCHPHKSLSNPPKTQLKDQQP